MNQKETMIENLLNELDDFYMQLVYLKDLLSVEEDMDTFKDKLQCAPNFTLIVESALIDSYMLVLMKLYDKSDKTETIPNLITKCKKNIHLFPHAQDTQSKLEEFEAKINQHEYISYTIQALRSMRDSVYAHNDKKYFGKNLVNNTLDFKMYHIWFLVKFTEEVLNYLFSQLSSKESRKTKYNKDLCNLFNNDQQH